MGKQDTPNGSAILVLLICTSFSSVHCSVGINVWPKPTTLSWPNPIATLISPNFTITSPNHQYLSPAVNRYLGLILTEHHQPLFTTNINLTTSLNLDLLIVTVSDLSAPLAHGVNESYGLTIPSSGGQAALRAETVWGAMRGLETFSQLVWGTPARVAAGVEVQDWPLFGHRGIMLDTSRNFFGVEDILRTIGAMSWNKLNVFHWHITDSHSFPIVLPSEPDLAAKGSYGPKMQYSLDDVKRIVQFGLEHGVRVLPELDTPGHTGSWAEAYPEIVICANMFWSPAGSESLAAEPGTGQLNPLNPTTYKVVNNIIRDLTQIFPDLFYHGGADEINAACWKTDPQIQAFLADGGTFSQILETFINSTFPQIVSRNRTVVYWEDVLLGTVNVSESVLPREHTVLQTWNNGPNNTKKIVSLGYRAIVSSADYYYLDCGHGSFLGNDSRYEQGNGGNTEIGGSWCGPYKTWQTIYDYDITYGLSEEEASLVLGGEVALWSEQADPTVLDSRVWPRASAMGEALWSGNRDGAGRKRYGDATDRLNEWRNRMVSRGVRAEPIQPLWCVRNPGMCNAVQPF